MSVRNREIDVQRPSDDYWSRRRRLLVMYYLSLRNREIDVQRPSDDYWSRRRRLLVMYLLQRRLRIQRPMTRRWHVRPTFQNRSTEGEWATLIQTMRERDPEKYFNYLRMSPDEFDYLLERVTPYIQRHSWRVPLSPGERLAMTLRYLASGQMMVEISYAWRVGTSTVSAIIRETCKALWTSLRNEVFEPFTTKLWEQVATDFEALWNFPNCVGAMDGKHCVFQAFAHSGSANHNYKGTNSLVLLALSDARYKFLMVDIGAKGRRSDGGVLKQSQFGKELVAGNLGLPSPRTPVGSDRNLPYVLLGDAAFPLRTNFMKPFPGEYLSDEKIIFNYRLSRARRVVENAFGIFSARWRIFRRPIIASEITGKAIIQATVCLHNFLMGREERLRPMERRYNPVRFTDTYAPDGSCIEGQWRNEGDGGCFEAPRGDLRMGSRNYSVDAAAVRSQYAAYFMNEGDVPWQWKILPQRMAEDEAEDEDGN